MRLRMVSAVMAALLSFSAIPALAGTMDDLNGKWKVDRSKLPAEVQKDFPPMSALLEHGKNTFTLIIDSAQDGKREFIYSISSENGNIVDVETIDKVKLRFEKLGPKSMSVGELKDGKAVEILYFVK